MKPCYNSPQMLLRGNGSSDGERNGSMIGTDGRREEKRSLSHHEIQDQTPDQ